MASSGEKHIESRPSLATVVSQAALSSLAHGVIRTYFYAQSWQNWFSPPAEGPDFIKTYECRTWLPVHVFIPKSFDPKSPKKLPTVFTIHGGGFIIGVPENDMYLNRSFADTHDVLVVALNYRKAPFAPWPTPIHDVEALMLAAFDDESLPIDKSRTAVQGYSAGGNLCLTVCQLPSIRDKVRPAAAIPVYAVCDFTRLRAEREATRYYKTSLGGKRGKDFDFLSGSSPTIHWAYLPYEHDFKDPLISPYFAPRDRLPQHLYFVSAELDQLCHETWGMASRLAGRPVPPLTTKVGQEQPAAEQGRLIQDDENFAFQHVEEGGRGSVNWLLVPDQIHGFDHWQYTLNDPAEQHDADLKVQAYQKVLGDWLHNVVWK